MDNEASILIHNAIEANQFIWYLAIFLFLLGTVLLSLYIKNVNNFTYIETLLASAGLKKYKRNWKIIIAHILVIIVPVLLMAYVVTSYNNA